MSKDTTRSKGDFMMKRILLLLGIVLCIGNGAVLAQPPELTGNEILQKSSEIYAALPSYSGNTAVISQANFDSGISLLQTATATITFQRYGKVHIEGRATNGTPYFIDSDGKKITLRYSVNKEPKKTQDCENLTMAIAGATGIAASAPTIIPAALIQSHWGNPFFKKEEATLVGKETINNAECYKIITNVTAKNSSFKYTYWVDTHSLLLNQMREEIKSVNNAGIRSSMSLFVFTNGKVIDGVLNSK
jgi:outer membrane lipoprotein-sorting protein